MIKGYSRNKKILFNTHLILGISYLLLVAVLSTNVLQSCYSIVAKENGYTSAFNVFGNRLDLLITFSSILLTIFLWIFLVKGLFQTTLKLFATKKYLNSLSTINNGDYRVIENKDNLAFTYGVISPQVYLSKNLITELTRNELKAVLTHEYKHKSENDPLKSLISYLINSIIIPLPFKSKFHNDFLTISEVIADKEAEAVSKSKRVVAETLLKLFDIRQKQILFISNFSSDNSRLEIFLTDKKFKIKTNLLLIALLSSVFIILPIGLVTAKPLNRCHEFYTCVDEYEEMDLINSEGTCIDKLYSKELIQSSIDKNMSTY
ncbi:MAG: M48 family metalloprotease [Candidatus Dojkabacteria bacterium]|nr:M48 family metalloprotease [Candidatus Dojkabacteria bacterium]MDQ7020741.1 M48 family metalloprotease [Candidatus Dojkabacteria bacterium]